VVNYWHLENKDPGMLKFGKERARAISIQFQKIVDEYCRGSYEDFYAIDQPLHKKSDQRLDFMMNVYKQIIDNTSRKLSELENERDRRL
jgi:hypothetical protein